MFNLALSNLLNYKNKDMSFLLKEVKFKSCDGEDQAKA
jgi:hypothetical protein